MKKFLGLLVMLVLILFQNSHVEAYNHYVGIYPESGLRAYLVTETVYRYYGGFNCMVVCYPNDRPYYIDYKFWLSDGRFYFKNSDGYSERVSGYTPVESNICKYVL